MTAACTILALQDEALKGLQERFRDFDAAPTMTAWIVVAVIALALAVVLIIFQKKRYVDLFHGAGDELLSSLALVHNLSGTQKRLLCRVAMRYNIESASVLFVRPTLALELLERMALDGRSGRRRAAKFAVLCRIIFGVSSRRELEDMEV